MATLRELQEQRDALDREIKERERELYALSIDNLSNDLGGGFELTSTLRELAEAAAKCGLALTTTKSQAIEKVFNETYSVAGEKWAEVAKRIVEGMVKKDTRDHIHTGPNCAGCDT